VLNVTREISIINEIEIIFDCTVGKKIDYRSYGVLTSVNVMEGNRLYRKTDDFVCYNWC
jgi:hypothetical protein